MKNESSAQDGEFLPSEDQPILVVAARKKDRITEMNHTDANSSKDDDDIELRIDDMIQRLLTPCKMKLQHDKTPSLLLVNNSTNEMKNTLLVDEQTSLTSLENYYDYDLLHHRDEEDETGCFSSISPSSNRRLFTFSLPSGSTATNNDKEEDESISSSITTTQQKRLASPTTNINDDQTKGCGVWCAWDDDDIPPMMEKESVVGRHSTSTVWETTNTVVSAFNTTNNSPSAISWTNEEDAIGLAEEMMRFRKQETTSHLLVSTQKNKTSLTQIILEDDSHPTWIAYWSEEYQREYYFNSVTNQVVWVIPNNNAAPQDYNKKQVLVTVIFQSLTFLVSNFVCFLLACSILVFFHTFAFLLGTDF